MHTSNTTDHLPNSAWRLSTIQKAQDFLIRHDAFSANHQQSIQRIISGCPIVRVSHQPNLFAGLNIGGLLIIAEELAKKSGGIVVFVSIDYDDAGDQRFRSPILPPLQGKNPIHIKGAVKKADRQKVAFAAPAPDIETAKSWVALHKQVAAHFGSNPSGSFSSLARLPITKLLSQSKSLTDFNLALLLHLSSFINDAPVIFVQASQCLPLLASNINLLVTKILRQYPEQSPNLVWRICDFCLRRCHTTLTLQEPFIHCAWYCPSCSHKAEQMLDWTTRIEPKDLPAFTPKVLLCDMIDHHIIQADVSVSYAGGIEHSIASRTLYKSLVGARDTKPEYTWRPSAMPFDPNGELQHLWKSGRFSSYLYHELFGAKYLKESILQSTAQDLHTLQ